ncbi:MAG TPA: hypothetical protein PK417_08085 [Hyphomonas sp.]|nr:hypothetical protein [Hyphomonas sp.]
MTSQIPDAAKQRITKAARDVVRQLDGKVAVERVIEKTEVADRLYLAHKEQAQIWAEVWYVLNDFGKPPKERRALAELRRFDEANEWCRLIQDLWPGGWEAYADDTYSCEPTEIVQKNKRQEQITETEALFRDVSGKTSGNGQNHKEALIDVWPLIVEFTERSKLHPIRKTHDEGAHLAQIVADLLRYELNDVLSVSAIKRKEKLRKAMGNYWAHAGHGHGEPDDDIREPD